MPEIFKNFRRFLIKFSTIICPLSQSDDKELLIIIQMFWYNKLEPLGKKILCGYELRRGRKLTEKRFRFIDHLLFNDSKVQIIWEYKRLHQSIQKEKKEKTTPNFFFERILSAEHFSFLAQHLQRRLKTLSTTEFLKDLDWLASQSRSFLSYFFYFLNYVKGNGIPPPSRYLADPSFAEIHVWAGDSICPFIILEKGNLFIFSKRIYIHEEEQAEAYKLACMILARLGIKSS